MFDITIDMFLLVNINLIGLLIIGIIMLIVGIEVGLDGGVFIALGIMSILISLGYLLTMNGIIVVHYI